MSVFPKLIDRFGTISVKIPKSCCWVFLTAVGWLVGIVELDKLALKFVGEVLRGKNSQESLVTQEGRQACLRGIETSYKGVVIEVV